MPSNPKIKEKNRGAYNYVSCYCKVFIVIGDEHDVVSEPIQYRADQVVAETHPHFLNKSDQELRKHQGFFGPVSVLAIMIGSSVTEPSSSMIPVR